MNEIEQLKKWINESPAKGIVFFGGAGVSTESGIPDFRSASGIYSEKFGELAPEQIVSHSYFMQDTRGFYDFYFDKMVYTEAEPNQAHTSLARLEEEGKLRSVVTQNIDGLHQVAGSEQVWELHGSIKRNYCMKCKKFFNLEETMDHRNAEGIPTCECGGVIKPDVVLYEEGLSNDVISGAINDIASADLLIIAGTSLVVYPAAGLIDYFNGKHIALINLSKTTGDARANLVIHDKVGEVLGQI